MKVNILREDGQPYPIHEVDGMPTIVVSGTRKPYTIVINSYGSSKQVLVAIDGLNLLTGTKFNGGEPSEASFLVLDQLTLTTWPETVSGGDRLMFPEVARKHGGRNDTIGYLGFRVFPAEPTRGFPETTPPFLLGGNSWLTDGRRRVGTGAGHTVSQPPTRVRGLQNPERVGADIIIRYITEESLLEYMTRIACTIKPPDIFNENPESTKLADLG